MMTALRRRAGLAAATAVAGLALAACGSADDTTDDPAADDTATEQDTATDEDMADDDGETAADDAALTPVGDACAELPAEGEGSAAAMAELPVAEAAASNPLLTELAQAVEAAGLVGDLNGLEGATVFAPTNSAFDALPDEQLSLLDSDTDLLTSVLTVHVVPQTITSADLDDGATVETLEGSQITVEFPEGESLPVVSTGPTSASVICADVQTGNAVVHVIDTVLTPPEDDA